VSAACSAAIAIGGDASGILVAWTSVAGCPRRGPRASNTSSKGLVATIPDAFARSSASCPSAAFATALFGARHFVVASLARVTREASSSAGEGVHPPSPEPRITLSTFIDGANWGEDFSFELPAIEFSIRERRPRFARNPSARRI